MLPFSAAQKRKNECIIATEAKPTHIHWLFLWNFSAVICGSFLRLFCWLLIFASLGNFRLFSNDGSRTHSFFQRHRAAGCSLAGWHWELYHFWHHVTVYAADEWQHACTTTIQQHQIQMCVMYHIHYMHATRIPSHWTVYNLLFRVWMGNQSLLPSVTVIATSRKASPSRFVSIVSIWLH